MNNSLYKLFFHFALLAFVISLSYSNTLESSWHFDDIPNIVSNQNIQIKNITWEEFKKIFYSPDNQKISRPVAYLTFAINYRISGLDTVSYHIFNILIHIFTSWLVYLIFIQTLHMYSTEKNANIPVASKWLDIALLGAVMWAIHPIQTQAVTFIVQRMASLATLFYLISLFCYLRMRETDIKGRKYIFFLLTIIFFLVGLGTKQNTILLPLAIAFYEIAFFRIHILPERKVHRFLIIMVFIILSLVLLWLFNENIIALLESYSVRKYSLWERLITQPIVLSRYLLLIFYPLADFLVFESDMSVSSGLLSPPTTLVAIFFISFLIFMAILYLEEYPFICYAILFYFVGHLIESTIVPLELYFEHRNYLPSIFIFLAISYYSVRLIYFYKNNNKIFMQNLIIITLIFILVGQGNAAYLRNDIYQDEISLHSDTIKKAPINPRPYVAIAVQHIDNNQFDEALEYLREAEKIYKNNPDRFQDNWVAMIYLNAGVAYRKKEQNDKALKLLFKSIQFYPSEWVTHANLGMIFFDKEDYEHAEDYFYNAVLLHPNCPAGLYNLFGRVLYANEKYDEAIKVFKKGLEIKDLNSLRYNLIASYIKKGNIDLAKSEILRMSYYKSKIDGIYYLYRAFLFPGSERERSLENISSMLMANQNNYCEWISFINANKSIDIIFPDIRSFQGDLEKSYLLELSKMKDHIYKKIYTVQSCIFEQIDQ